MSRVALAYNLIKLSCIQDAPLDCIAEYDTPEAIQAIADALQAGGHEVILLEDDRNFTDRLKAAQPDIVFNIAEGVDGECREAQVPSVCEAFGIPYTGSGVQTLALCLNKARTNEVLAANGLAVPAFQVFYASHDALAAELNFPLIVKLLHEGSSMGLSEKSVVDDHAALRLQVQYLLDTYRQPALVQQFIIGREFTVGILGNRFPAALPITEVTFPTPYGIVTFNLDDELVPLVERQIGVEGLLNFKKYTLPHTSVCPADIDPRLAERIRDTAVHTFRALGCRDWGRIDFRLGVDRQLYVLEANPIAGIAPGYWLPNSARVANLDYPAFINRILDIALDRIQGGNCY